MYPEVIKGAVDGHGGVGLGVPPQLAAQVHGDVVAPLGDGAQHRQPLHPREVEVDQQPCRPDLSRVITIAGAAVPARNQ
eukprot:5428879-Alexandrium_andersonii.AAC.1